MLEFTARNIEWKAPDVVSFLYDSMALPHLEYAVQLCSPNYRKDIDSLKRIQQRDTKIIPTLRVQPCEERVKHHTLFTP